MQQFDFAACGDFHLLLEAWERRKIDTALMPPRLSDRAEGADLRVEASVWQLLFTS